jgi:hypothetical protein
MQFVNTRTLIVATGLSLAACSGSNDDHAPPDASPSANPPIAPEGDYESNDSAATLVESVSTNWNGTNIGSAWLMQGTIGDNGSFTQSGSYEFADGGTSIITIQEFKFDPGGSANGMEFCFMGRNGLQSCTIVTLEGSYDSSTETWSLWQKGSKTTWSMVLENWIQ